MRMQGNAALLSIALAVSFVSNVVASGIFSNPGARAVSLGGAYSAVAEDLTGIYYNPAGLTQLEGNNVMLSGIYLNIQAKSNTPPANAAVPNKYDNDFPASNLYAYLGNTAIEPAQYINKRFDVTAMLPFAAGNFRLNDKDVIAVGFYATGGGGGRWDDTVNSNVAGDYLHASGQVRKAFMVGNVSAARQVSENLSLALGLNYIYMQDQMTVAKEYNAGSGSPVSSYSFYGDYDASGGNVEGVIGALYKINDRSRAGLTFRTGTDIKLTGTGIGRTTGLTALTGGVLPDSNKRTSYTEKFKYPMTLAMGYSYKPSRKLLLAAEYEYLNYKPLRNETTYDSPDTLFFINSNEDARWKDVHRVKFGAEYNVDDVWTLRGGLSNDPGVYNFDEKTIFDTFMYSLFIVDTGFGYRKGAFGVDFDLCTLFSDNPERNGRTYEFNGNMFRLTGSYRFN